MTPHEYRIAAEELNAQADALAAIVESLRSREMVLRNLEAGAGIHSEPAADIGIARLYLSYAVGNLERAAVEMGRRAA